MTDFILGYEAYIVFVATLGGILFPVFLHFVIKAFMRAAP